VAKYHLYIVGRNFKLWNWESEFSALVKYKFSSRYIPSIICCWNSFFSLSNRRQNF